MDTIASQITSLTIVYSTFYSGADQRKHQSSASLAFVRRIHRWPGTFSSSQVSATHLKIGYMEIRSARMPARRMNRTDLTRGNGGTRIVSTRQQWSPSDRPYCFRMHCRFLGQLSEHSALGGLPNCCLLLASAEALGGDSYHSQRPDCGALSTTVRNPCPRLSHSSSM